MSSLSALPSSALEFMSWSWEQIAPYYDELATREINASNVEDWLKDWSQLASLLDETRWRLNIAIAQNTADTLAEQSFQRYLDNIEPPASQAEQRLKAKLLESGLVPKGFEIPLRNLRAEAEIYRDTNVPLFAKEKQLCAEHDKIGGEMTVLWEDAQVSLMQVAPVLHEQDRARRELAFRRIADRIEQARPAYDALWTRLLNVRREMAANAGFENYRAYRWQALKRFDYTPNDSMRFVDAIEQVVVPVATRLRERGKQRLGLDILKPWDQTSIFVGNTVVPREADPPPPFSDNSDLMDKAARTFRSLDSQFGTYFETMRREQLLDLSIREHKAPGGFCVGLDTSHQPFIFLSMTKTYGAVNGLLHECGHAFHSFASGHLPYWQQRNLEAGAMEFGEIPSTAMELLATPYVGPEFGGFFTREESAAALHEKLERYIFLFTGVAVIEAFQHWVYEHQELALDPGACDEEWDRLWARFEVGIDWSDLPEFPSMLWRYIYHIFQAPFYNIEYAISLLGALQLWVNAQQDERATLAAYKHALTLGNSAAVPELFAAAGISFSFDRDTLRRAVNLIQEKLTDLEQIQG